MKSLQLNQPHILILIGLPGSGRTTFANRFSSLFNAPYVDVKSFASVATDNDKLAEIGQKVVEQLIKTNQTIVYEGVTGSRSERQEIAKIAKDAGYTPLLVWFQVNQSVAKQRADKNSKSAHPLVREIYDTYRFTAPNNREHYVVVSGMHTYPAQAKTVLRRLTELSGRADTSAHKLVGRQQQSSSSAASARSIRVQ